MKKVLLVLTGGTIGSCEKSGVISADPKSCRILDIYHSRSFGSDIEFVTEMPYNILSENLNADNWKTLIAFILSYDLHDFEGIIITHGSDTLSYTSAMLGICLHGMKLPVVITASDFVPDDPRSNALANFKAAVDLILQKKSGVYTVYKNKTDKYANIFIPTRLCEADRINDIFAHADGSAPAYIDENGLISENNCSVELKKLETKENSIEINTRAIEFDKKVLLIHPYPDMNYDDILINDNVYAVLHVTYHSGTVSSDAAVLLDKCKEKNIPLFLCSLKNSRSLYETSNTLIKNGAVPLYNINTESAYAKLMLAAGLCPENTEELMNTDMYYEILT